MGIKPTVAIRAALAGGVAVLAKFGGLLKAAGGGAKLGTAAAAVTAAAAAAVSGSKDSQDKNKS